MNLEPWSTVVFTYNSLQRTTSETQGANPLGGGGSTFTYAYNAAGSLSSVQYPSGVTQTRNLDAGERLASTAISGGATLATYTWAGGRVLQVAFQSSVTKTFTHDVLWRSTRVKYANTGGTLKDFEYLYNLASQRLLEKRHHAGGAGDLYELDSLYRTVKVKESVADPLAEYNSPGSQTVQATIVPTYDAANNRTNVAVTTSGGATNTGYTADALNFYTAVGGVTHVRDANGNLTDDGTNLYDYDYRNQLVRVRLKSGGAVIALYDYDALGRRTSKAAGGTTISFLWSGQQMVVESDSSGVLSRRHLGASFGEVVSATNRDVADLDGDSSTTDYVALTPMYDGAFDCVGVLDPAGAVAESYVHSYDGKVSIANGAGTPIAASAIAWQQGYGRMYRDDETSWLYSLFRYYSPVLGRFVTRDPVGDWYTSSNLGNGYGWVGNGYRNALDPLGLDEDKCCGKRAALFMYDDSPHPERYKRDGKTLQKATRDYDKEVGETLALLNRLYGADNVHSHKCLSWPRKYDGDAGSLSVPLHRSGPGVDLLNEDSWGELVDTTLKKKLRGKCVAIVFMGHSRAGEPGTLAWGNRTVHAEDILSHLNEKDGTVVESITLNCCCSGGPESKPWSTRTNHFFGIPVHQTWGGRTGGNGPGYSRMARANIVAGSGQRSP